ncbi:MAG: hypothetical protein AAF721_21885 [Myxococcota bacterium]
MGVAKPELTELDDGLWITTAPIGIVGMPLRATMTILRLDAGELLLHSPVALTPARKQAVEALGAVTHLYAPNLFHHLRLGEWATAFPKARVHGPAGLGSKRKDLQVNRVHGELEPAFEGLLDEVVVDGFRLAEGVLFHRATGTLVVADLVHNIGRPPHWWTKLYAGAMGFYGEVALSRVIRWTAFSDRAAARRSLDTILELPFERIVVGHGAPVVRSPREALADAYRWLPPGRAALSGAAGHADQD